MECLKDLCVRMYVCVLVHAYHSLWATSHMWRGRLAGMGSPLHHVGPRHQTQVVRLGGKHFFLLRLLASLGYPFVAV